MYRGEILAEVSEGLTLCVGRTHTTTSTTTMDRRQRGAQGSTTLLWTDHVAGEAVDKRAAR